MSTESLRFTKGDRVEVVELDVSSDRVREVTVLAAVIERANPAFVQARLESGFLWSFYQDSGVSVTHELSCWRLRPAVPPEEEE